MIKGFTHICLRDSDSYYPYSDWVVTSLTGLVIIPGMAPLEDALAVVASIGIAMLGSLPGLAEFLTRLLKQPLLWLGKNGHEQHQRGGVFW